jgi:4-hydroxy-2-oxovalerate aldolase
LAESSSRIFIVDTTLRDGSHAVSHQFTLDQVESVAAGLDEAGVHYIEVSHGDGLSGSSQNYGWALYSDEEKLKVASKVIEAGNLTVLLLPGIGTINDLEMAKENGAKATRIATHVTEADIAEQHIKTSRKLGMKTFGFLMMAHMVSKEKVLEQAKLLESYGSEVVYMADSAGAMLPHEVAEKVNHLTNNLDVPIGFHAHNNLGLAIANNLAAIDAGATYLDSSLRGLGAGAGNAQTEVLIGVLEKYNRFTGIDFYKAMDVAEDVLAPMLKWQPIVDKSALVLGYAGVYSSFLIHTQRAAERFKLDPRDILVELGKRKMVGGQEDMIIDVAYNLYNARQRGKQ